MQLTAPRSDSSHKAHPCLWMQAGVIQKRLCQDNFNCIECRFDRVIGRIAHENQEIREASQRPKGKRGKIIPWKDKLRSMPLSRRPCIHHMRERIDFKACTHEYRCGNCDFDQFFHDEYSVHAVVKPIDFLEVHGFKIPQGYYFHQGHTWIKIEEAPSVRVGIDEFALRVMGPFDRIEAPLMGKEVKQGAPHIQVHRGGRNAMVLSPISGIVTASNTRLGEEGNLAGKDPFSEGWVMRVHANNLRQDLKQLMIHREPQGYMEKEIDRLYGLIEEVAAPLPTDGGHLGDDLFGKMPQLGWARLTRVFLRT